MDDIMNRMISLKHISYSIIVILLCNMHVMATDSLVVVRGYVFDAANHQPLANVNVVEKNRQIGTSTDINGFFYLRMPTKTFSLSISHVSYEDKQISIISYTPDTLLHILLTRSDIQLGEVNVTASKPNVLNIPQMGVISLSQEGIKNIPTLFGEADVIKALQTQPGVSAGAEGLSGMYVRGGNEDENLYMLDGIPVYKILHLGGLFSAINVEAVQDITFYKSSFPSRYGGRLSSVLNVRTREGDMKKYHGSLMLGLTSANVNIDGPIIKEKTSFAASIRRSWLEVLSVPGLAVMNKNSKSKGEKTFGRYAFTDANVKLNHIFNSRSSANLIFYYGDDYFKIGDQTFMKDGFYFIKENMTRMNWGNLLIAGKWKYIFNDKMLMDVSSSYVNYTSLLRKSIFESDNQKGDIDYKESTIRKASENGIRDLNGNVHFDFELSVRHHINFGANYTHHRFLPELNKIQTSDLDAVINYESDSEAVIANEMAFYAEDDWNISDIFRLNAGLRFSLFRVDRKTYHTWEPRISLRTALSERLSLKSSYSRMNQFVQQISDSYISLPTDFWMPVNHNFKPLGSDQISAGLFYEHPLGYSFSVEGFYKYMRNLLEYKEGYAFMPVSAHWDQKLTQGRGWSYGAELTVEKKTGKLTGLLGYGLLWSDRQFAELNQGIRFPSKYDNRHKINIVANYKINPTLELNSSWTYITGNRMTLMFEDYLNFSVNGFDPIIAPTNPFQDEWVNYYKGKNNIRLPAYHRLDLGLNIYHPLKNGRMGIWNISIWNAYCRMNPIAIRTYTMYSDGEKRKISPRFQTVGLFPIIPSVSYTYKF